jgi:hypothetical protein
MGAAETIPMDGHNRIIEGVKELTGGVFCDESNRNSGMLVVWAVEDG